MIDVLNPDGNPTLLILGPYPGKEELRRGKPFVGKSGKILRGSLSAWPGRVVLTNIRHRPNEEPNIEHVNRVINNYSPQHIITFGIDVYNHVRKIWGGPLENYENPASVLWRRGRRRAWVEGFKYLLYKLSGSPPKRVFVVDNTKIALDCETLSDPYFGFEIVALVTDSWEKVFFGPTDELKDLLKGSSVVGHNLIYDLIALQAKGVDISQVSSFDDTMVAYGVHRADGSRDLQVLSALEVGDILKDPPYKDWRKGKIPKEEFAKYCVEHARATLKLWSVISSRINRVPLYTSLYRQAIPVVSKMYRIDVDFDRLQIVRKYCETQMREALDALNNYAPINWNSHDQVSEYLLKNYPDLKLPTTEKSGKPSLRAPILNDLLKNKDIPEVCLLLKYRQAQKILTTYVENIEQRGAIYTTYNLVGTETGRTSSSNMNCQNIPKMIRWCCAAPEGYVYLNADLKSAEYAVGAYVSKDRFMISSLRSGDPHTYTARYLVGREPTEDERRSVKAITFGLMYLATPETISEYATRLGGSQDVYEAYYRWWELHDGYFKWVQRVSSDLRTKGFYQGPTGRIYRKLTPGSVTLQDIREVVNAVIQGSTSDFALKALIQLSYLNPVVFVHDSISFIVPVEKLEQVKGEIEEGMSNVLPGYLSAKVEASRSWGTWSPGEVAE